MLNGQKNHNILIQECDSFEIIKNKFEYRKLCQPNNPQKNGLEKFLKIFGVKKWQKLSDGNLISFSNDMFHQVPDNFWKNLCLEISKPKKTFSFSSGESQSLNFINQRLIQLMDQYFIRVNKDSDIHIQHYVLDSIPTNSKFNVLIQPLDGDKLDSRFIPVIDKYDLIITPSSSNKLQLQKSGIIKPIEVIPNFYIEEESREIRQNKIKNQKFTFYSETTMITRKNIENTLKYFIEAFLGTDFIDSVKFIIKITTTKEKEERLNKIIKEYKPKDIPEIIIINEFLEEAELNDLWKEVDCYICLSYMEGFCIPALKAVSCNIPVIALDSKISGYMDFLDENNSILLPCKEIKIINDSESILIHSQESTWEEVDYTAYKKSLKKVLNKKFTFRDISEFEHVNVMSKYINSISSTLTSDKPIEHLKKDYFNNFVKKCKGLIKFLSKEFPKIDKNSCKKSLLVETRELDHNEFVIKNTIQKLGDGWGHIIYCHKNNYKQIKSICDEISFEIEIRLVEKDLDRNDYNNLLLDINFWNEIDCEKILIYQTDTFILNRFDNSFLDYDYIGAPWIGNNLKAIQKIYKEVYNTSKILKCGNGGLSLRNVSKLKQALTDEDYISKMKVKKSESLDRIAEDVYFSIYLTENGISANQISETFAFEIDENYEIVRDKSINLDTFGFHKLHLHPDYFKTVKQETIIKELEEKCETFIFVHDQNIILDFIRNRKLSELKRLKFVFLGNREIDKIVNINNVIISRNLDIQIEDYPNLTSFTGWYSLWKNNLISSNYINLLEYDVNISSDFYEEVLKSINDNKAIIGYIPFSPFNQAFIDTTEWSKELVESIYKNYSIDVRKFLSNLDKDYICSITSNHTFRKDIFEDYMRWIEPMIDDIKVVFCSGQQVERSIILYYILNEVDNVKILPDILSHFQFNSHFTQDISTLKKIQNYKKLYDSKKIERDFDWLIYFIKNLDLLNEIEFSEESAKNHFINHGFEENRPYYFENEVESVRVILKNHKIILFYHLYCENDWKDIFNEQSKLIVESGLFFELDTIFINVIGTEIDINYIQGTQIGQKSKIVKVENNFEFPTFKLMIEMSRVERFKGIYIHSKSSSYILKDKRKKFRNIWRDFMNYHIISEWKTCYNSIQEYELVGTLFKRGNCETDIYWREYSFENQCKIFTDHFSGNFFWFDSEYMKNIEFLNSEQEENRFNAEFLVFRNNPNYFEIFLKRELWKNKLNYLYGIKN